VLLADSAGNDELLGDPAALPPADVRSHVQGFVATADAFEPVPRAACPKLKRGRE